jgi:AP-1 complex subunit beta-1
MQLPVLQPSESASTLLPMKLFQNVSEGPPNSALQVAVKNNQPAIVYFKDKIPLQALFVEDGRMERATFLEVIYHPLTYSGIYVDFIGLKVFEVAWSVSFVSGFYFFVKLLYLRKLP